MLESLKFTNLKVYKKKLLDYKEILIYLCRAGISKTFRLQCKFRKKLIFITKEQKYFKVKT